VCADIWKKFPVIQHFFFGSVLTVNLPELTVDDHARVSRGAGAGEIGPGVNARFNPPPPGLPVAAGLPGESLDDMVVTRAPWAK